MPAAVALVLLLAQSPPAEAGEAARLERIRKALAEPPSIFAPQPARQDALVFRVTVRAWTSDQAPWANWSPIPTNIRPWFRLQHHEFLEQVTKEEFRSATLYPTGVPVVPMVESLVKGVKAANRRRKEANAKEEVRRALEELIACRADPARPGC